MAKKKEANKKKNEKDIGEFFLKMASKDFKSIEDMKSFLDQAIGKTVDEIFPEKRGKKSKEEKAQDLIIEAFSLPPEKGRKLVDKALKLDPNNPDAYIYLAEVADDLEGAIKYYSLAVDAGKKYIGEDFEALKGHFWMARETRPFMQAKAGLASCLYLINDFESAIQHFQEMIKLNPNDNQGVRYQLAICLVAHNKNEAYQNLLKEYDDGTADWLYTKALYLFKQHGSSLKSNRALKEAYDSNPHVCEFLAGVKLMPDHLPANVILGEESEAVSCLNESGKIWIETDGAIAWVSDFYERQ